MGEVHTLPGLSSNLTPEERAFRRQYESEWRGVVEMLMFRGRTSDALEALVGCCVSNAVYAHRSCGELFAAGMLESLRELADGIAKETASH